MEYIKIPNIYEREKFGKNRLIEGRYSSPVLAYLSGLTWYFTEKVDGTNVRVIWDGYRVSFAGRTDRAQIPDHLLMRLNELFGGESKEELFEQTFGKKEVILFGEGFGEKIQKGGGLYGPVDFILFDVYINGYWLRISDVKEVARGFDIRSVPIVHVGTLTDGVEYVRTHPRSMLRDAEMEGVVGRPLNQLFTRDGDPVIVKIKCRDFDRKD